MTIQIEGNQIQNNAIGFAKLLASDIETTLVGSSAKLARADAIKAYVDNIAAGIHWKDSVKCATTANITLSGEQTLDGITTSGSRVLVRAQTDASENGIYVSASGAWSRASDMDESAEFAGAAVFVREGTTYADVGFVCTNDADPAVGTDDINFTQFTGAATLTAGDGLTKTGNTFDVNVDDSSVEIAADALQIKALGVTNAMLAGGIANAKLLNSTISGVALGSSLNSMSVVTGSALSMTSFNGSAAVSDLAVQVDDSSVEIASNAIRVKAAGVTNAMLQNSTISGVALGSNLNALTAGNGLSMTSYNGSAAVSDLTIALDGGTLSVGASGLKVADSGISNTQLAGSIAADKLNLGDGLEADAGALKVDLDGSTIARGVNGIKVADLGIDTAQIAASAVTNAKLQNSTISGVALGSNLNALTAGNGLSMTSYNGSAAVSDLTIALDGGTLSVGASGLKVADSGISNTQLAGSIAADKLNLGDGLEADAGALKVDLDGSTIARGANGIKVADAGIDTAQIADSAVSAAKVSFVSNWDTLSPNGSLTAFDLSETVSTAFAMLIVVRNGITLKQVASSPSGQDEYSVSLTGGAGGVTRLIFGAAPTNGADLRVWYLA